MACKYTFEGKEYTASELKILYGALSQPYGRLEIKMGLREEGGRYVRSSIRSLSAIKKKIDALHEKHPNIVFKAIKVPGFGPNRGKMYHSIKIESAGKKDSFTTNYLPNKKEGEGVVKYAELSNLLKNRYNDIDRKLLNINNTIRVEKSVEKLKKLNATKARLEEMLEGVHEELNKAGKATKLEDLRSFANEHLDRAESLISEDMTDSEIAEARSYIELWKRAGDFSKNTNIFFSKEELESDKLKYGYENKAGEKIPGFSDFKVRAEAMSANLSDIIRKNMTKKVNEVLETDYSESEVLKEVSDLNNLSTNVLDISRQGDPLLNAVYKITKRASLNSKFEIDDVVKEIDTLLKEALPSLEKHKKNKDLYSIFMQRDSAGRETGNLVGRASQSFYDKQFELLNNAKKKSKKEKGYKAGWDEYYNFKKNNTITFDPRVLFPTSEGDSYHYPHSFSEGARESLIQEIKAQLGSKGYDLFFKKAQEDVEVFKRQYEAVKDELSESELDRWNKENSPYYAARMIEDGKSIKDSSGKLINPKNTYVQTVPRKTNKSTGESTEWYDDQYKIIESDPTLLKFYEKYLDTQESLLAMIPEHKREGIYANSLISIRKDIFDKMQDSPVSGMFAHGLDSMKNSIRMTDLSETTYGQKDEFGNIVKGVNVNIASDRKAINESTKVKVINFKAKNGRAPTRSEYVELRSQSMGEASAEKSHDIGKILKMLAAQSIAYKHKSKHEDTLRLASHLMLERDRVETNAMGTVMTDEDGSPLISNKKLDNYEKVLENHIDNSYGISTKKVEGKSKKKVYTLAEKKKKKGLENALVNLQIALDNKTIDSAEYESSKANIDKQLEILGGVITGNKVADAALKYVQLKSMGWNIPSAFANIAFGDIANLLLASDGRLFSLKQFYKARSLTLGSTLKASGFKNKGGLKISKWMEKLDILKDASEELYKRSNEGLFSKKLSSLAPYELQKRSEFLVSAPVMIGMMLNTNVTKDGETSSLWDILDESGNIPEGYMVGSKALNQDFMVDFKIQVDQAVKKTHGNYDSESPVVLKNAALGRLVSQFRTWMFEGVASRFESEKRDDILNMQVKGRWRSYGSAFNSIDNSLFTMKQLIRKATLQSTQFDERMSEVDAANMRANLTEVMILMSLYGFAAVLSAFSSDDEEKDPYVLNFLMNQMGRLQTDILLYVNPTEVQKIQKSIIPATVIVDDVGGWIDAIGYFMEGKDTLKTGPNKDDSRLLMKTMKLLPGTSSYLKGKQQFTNNYVRD